MVLFVWKHTPIDRIFGSYNTHTHTQTNRNFMQSARDSEWGIRLSIIIIVLFLSSRSITPVHCAFFSLYAAIYQRVITRWDGGGVIFQHIEISGFFLPQNGLHIFRFAMIFAAHRSGDLRFENRRSPSTVLASFWPTNWNNATLSYRTSSYVDRKCCGLCVWNGSSIARNSHRFDSHERRPTFFYRFICVIKMRNNTIIINGLD